MTWLTKTRDAAIKATDIVICFVRKTWRPATCLAIAASAWENLYWIPHVTQKPIEFGSASVYVAAITAAFTVREVGKYLGTADK